MWRPWRRSLIMVRTLLILSGVFLGAFPAYAGEPPVGCDIDWGVSCYGMRISICPQGDFELISEGCWGDDDYIWVVALNPNGDGRPGIPVTDFWLLAAYPDEELCLCTNSVAADSVTNSEGRTTLSGSFSGGGCARRGLMLRVMGLIALEPDCINPAVRDIVIVSPDLNADCLVNLSDLGIFGHSYNKDCGDSGYNDCCDYNDDCHCNLSDFAWLGEHYQHACTQ